MILVEASRYYMKKSKRSCDQLLLFRFQSKLSSTIHVTMINREIIIKNINNRNQRVKSSIEQWIHLLSTMNLIIGGNRLQLALLTFKILVIAG